MRPATGSSSSSSSTSPGASRWSTSCPRSNADLNSFAYLAAHELKSPLQALTGFSALLGRVHGEDMGPQAREFLGWIVDGATRMHCLIDALLAYCPVARSETRSLLWPSPPSYGRAPRIHVSADRTPGGEIWVEPNATGGSRFRFSLPDVAAPTSALAAA